MNKVLSFTWSSNELAKAQNLQRQITQKDLQLTLLEIDNRYKPIFGYYNNSSNMLSLQSISIERNNLIYQRDNCISGIIFYKKSNPRCLMASGVFYKSCV